MSENPSAIQKFLNKYNVAPWMAAVLGAALGFLLVCLGFYLPFSEAGVDPVSKELKLGGNLDNWRKNAGFLMLVALCIFAGLALMFASIQVVRGEERKSQRDRQIVYAFFYDPSAPSYAQIAERLGVSPETVGPLRTRCLRRLRAALDRLPAFNDRE